MGRDKNTNNLFSLYQKIGTRYKRSEIFTFGNFNVVKTIGSVWPNIAYLPVEKDLNETVIDRVGPVMSELQMKPLIISTYSPDTEGKFRSRGFAPIEQWIGMTARELSKKKPELTGSDTHIYVVSGLQQAEAWTRVISEVLFNSSVLDSAIFRMLATEGAELIGIKEGGELVGTSMIYVDEDGVAGIYMVCIKEAYRGRGLAKKMIGYCLDELKHKRVDECFLQSTRTGLSVYKALGFIEETRYLIYYKIK